jgi:quinoprotein glucose dehydrogenase
VTKQSFVFLLDRETGQPLFPIEERATGHSNIPGEELWPTQPFPLKPPPLSRINFTRDQVTDIDPETHKKYLDLWDNTDAGMIYIPTTFRGTFVHPGFRGGALWGGCCFDPERNLLFASSDENTNRITLAHADSGEPFEFKLSERARVRHEDRYPIIKPPWGHMTAIDCDKGEFRWRVVDGEFPELTAKGIPKTGTPSYGGSIATKGGLIFLSARIDLKMRALDSDTGTTLWEHQLDAGGFATPCSYQVNGKQYVVIAAGGGHGDSPSGDEYIAFALDS